MLYVSRINDADDFEVLATFELKNGEVTAKYASRVQRLFFENDIMLGDETITPAHGEKFMEALPVVLSTSSRLLVTNDKP
jgi:hypothetical protein